MKILDIGEAFYLLSEIAYMTKDKDTVTGNPRISIFLKGNNVKFTVELQSIQQRDECYAEWKDMVVNLK